MAIIPLNFGGGGGTGSDDVTATRAQILEGYTAITHDSNDEPIEGTMVNRGAVSQSLNTSTTSYTVPQGYHNGSGKVSITTQEKSITPTTSSQNVTPDSGKVLSKVTVNAISTQEKTTSATTSSQAITPDSGKYLSKVNIRALTQTNLTSANIFRGKTISINNGSTNVWSVAGSNNTLKLVSGSVNLTKSNTTKKEIAISGQNTLTCYYYNVNAGITPCYILTYRLTGDANATYGYPTVFYGLNMPMLLMKSNAQYRVGYSNYSSLMGSSSSVPIFTSDLTTTATTVYYYIWGY